MFGSIMDHHDEHCQAGADDFGVGINIAFFLTSGVSLFPLQIAEFYVLHIFCESGRKKRAN
jgi:hypothetical protein